ncbi:MAG: [NiFe]-hydrogenase assembly chaperone HybE [Rubrivivax sp.]|nr:[NiFe]-hydrogenase assembly chaperone HybE [Rubrivivax sp.]
MTDAVLQPPAPALLPDPSPRLNDAFREVAKRMQGLGFVNPALEVEAVAFEPWQGHWLGVMVTPWFMNLVLLPRDRRLWQTVPVRAKRKLHFPAGSYEFIGSDDPVIGEHQTCSLFSPMHEFEDHAAARLVARLAREALFDAANAEAPEYPRADLSPATQADAAAQEVALGNRGCGGRIGGSSHVDRR